MIDKPADSLNFRPVRAEDQSTIARMMKDLYRALQLPDGYMTDEKIRLTFDQLQRQPAHLMLDVFEWRNEIAGYALLFNYWYNEFGGMVLNIDELFVDSQFRNKGIAAAYIKELNERKGRDYVALTLEVLPSNLGAYSLYKKNGFSEKETVALYKIL